MSLYEKLQKVKTEEEVKDIYIKALGLKSVEKNLVDIQTKEIWFESKKSNKSTIQDMFTQLFYYVKIAREKGEEIPPFLCVIDQSKASIMETKNSFKIIENKNIKWGKSASHLSQESIDAVANHIGAYFVQYNLEHYEDEFIACVKNAISKGELIRSLITPDNLKQVFDKWVEMIGKELSYQDKSSLLDDLMKIEDYATLFYADIMNNGTGTEDKFSEDLNCYVSYRNDKPLFNFNGKVILLKSINGYTNFWNKYERPPKQEYRNYLLERRDSLIPSVERNKKGAFYTPLQVVDTAYDYITNSLGKNWQKNWVIWDMCCGVGNLEAKHSNPRNIFMSTLDKTDVNIIKNTKACVGANIFQYDYLNDDIAEDGSINYSITNKIPKELQEIIKNGTKKVLVLINPPYAENGAGINKGLEGKAGVSNTLVAKYLMTNYGKSTNELFTQFIARILKELPSSHLAMFSKLKYVNAPNFEEFRENFKANYKDGFIVHSKAFDGLNGNFPIGFLIWDLSKKQDITTVTCDIYTKTMLNIGEKSFYNLPKEKYLNKWITRPRINKDFAIPLSNAISISTVKKPLLNWSDNAIAYMCQNSNDLQHSNQNTFLVSSVYGHGHGMYINKENILSASIVFTVRRVIESTWINDRDQFLQPNCSLPTEFQHDCLIWMLFNGSNLTASTDELTWENKKHSITNHFIPFTEAEVEADGRFESHFMIDFLKDKKLSTEAKLVLNEAKLLWQEYYRLDKNHKLREKYKLDRVDVGWYQIRKVLEEHQTDFTNFKTAYKTLSDKLIPQVYDYGFLMK